MILKSFEKYPKSTSIWGLQMIEKRRKNGVLDPFLHPKLLGSFSLMKIWQHLLLPYVKTYKKQWPTLLEFTAKNTTENMLEVSPKNSKKTVQKSELETMSNLNFWWPENGFLGPEMTSKLQIYNTKLIYYEWKP